MTNEQKAKKIKILAEKMQTKLQEARDLAEEIIISNTNPDNQIFHKDQAIDTNSVLTKMLDLSKDLNKSLSKWA